MTATHAITDVLAVWMRRQRWFAGKSASPQLRVIGSWELESEDLESADPESDPEVSITTYLVLDDGAVPRVLYQVPITTRHAPLESGWSALIAELTDPAGEAVYLYDGPHDPAYARSLLAFVTSGGHVDGVGTRVDGIPAESLACVNVRSHVLGGEQSNTSIVYDFDAVGGESGRAAICKVFRTLHHGENPDVVLQSALFAAGSHAVPATLGSVVAEWSDPREPLGHAVGHLAFAQEFLTGAEDAWRRARAAFSDSVDFSENARAIGTATADVHATLANVMPTVSADEADIAETVAAWNARLDAAVAEAPELDALREQIGTVFQRAATSPWPRLQRIHGDLHLGQVLGMPGGDWVIIDFEGEPMRPLSERTSPDVALRDVAGMLRSFDYVAGTERGSLDVVGWVDACRRAFIEGYSERSGEDVMAHGVLVGALELDKALYEVVYEARNRPAWLPIPLAAIHRILQRAQ
ncbi:MAG TPA: phosphotransferase [Microbacteriaceae bacterium]|jgi:predicted trehalose synthase|nr:phosphotransferase [Microbacteriaceae bacterium]